MSEYYLTRWLTLDAGDIAPQLWQLSHTGAYEVSEKKWNEKQAGTCRQTGCHVLSDVVVGGGSVSSVDFDQLSQVISRNVQTISSNGSFVSVDIHVCRFAKHWTLEHLPDTIFVHLAFLMLLLQVVLHPPKKKEPSGIVAAEICWHRMSFQSPC